jgi:hypothetical protein
MRIDLNNNEIYKILQQHFSLKEGDAIRLNYSEPTSVWKSRINYEEKVINVRSKSELPEKIYYHLWL